MKVFTFTKRRWVQFTELPAAVVLLQYSEVLVNVRDRYKVMTSVFISKCKKELLHTQLTFENMNCRMKKKNKVKILVKFLYISKM